MGDYRRLLIIRPLLRRSFKKIGFYNDKRVRTNSNKRSGRWKISGDAKPLENPTAKVTGHKDRPGLSTQKG